MTFASDFANPVGFQLLENVPFYHALARVSVSVRLAKQAVSIQTSLSL